MPSEVTQAIGTAQQYMSNQKVTYEKRLLGVQQNWNVTPVQDGTRERIGKTLEALGVSMGQQDLQNEKNQFEIAKVIAPQYFEKLSDKEKQTLSNAQILANTGEYNLIDNRYAIGVLDQLRGKYTNARFNQEYRIWSQNQPLAGSLEEEQQRYHDFMEKSFNEWSEENPNLFDNQYAFYNGYLDAQAENVVNVSSDYLDKKEKQYQQDRFTTLLSQADDIFRGLQYRKDITDEELRELFMPFMTQVNLTQGKDPEFEYKLLQEIMQKAVEHTGDQRIVNFLGEFTDYRGKPIKDTINPKALTELTTAQSQRMMNQQAVADQKELNSFTSASALRDWHEKNMETDPEKARRLAPFIEPRAKQLEAEEKALLSRQARQVGLKGTAETRTALYNQIINNVTSGKVVGVPQTEKELEALGGNVAEMNVVMLARIDEMVQAGDDASVATMVNTPLARKGLQAYFSQHLAIDLNRGEMTPSVAMALKLAGKSGKYIEEAIGSQYANDVTVLKMLVDTNGEQEGLQVYRESRKRLNDPDERKRIQDNLKYVAVNDLSVYDLYYDAETPYSYNPDSLPYDITNKISKLSESYYATGLYSEEQSKDLARLAVQQQYVAVHGIFIPATDYQQIVNGNTSRTNQALQYIMNYYTNEYRYKATWNSNGSQMYLSVSTPDGLKSYDLDKIINDVNYATDQYAKQGSSSTNNYSQQEVIDAIQNYVDGVDVKD